MSIEIIIVLVVIAAALVALFFKKHPDIKVNVENAAKADFSDLSLALHAKLTTIEDSVHARLNVIESKLPQSVQVHFHGAPATEVPVPTPFVTPVPAPETPPAA